MLEGRVVIVTGGASGLGAAICTRLASDGAHVVIADLSSASAAQVAERLAGARGRVRTHTADIGCPDQAATLVQSVIDEFGRLDVLVNNAGVDRTVAVEALAVSDWERIVRTNLTAPFLLARAAIPHMRGRGSGAIVNITSTAARRAWPNAAAYHASKWGLLGLSHALHAELREARIRVTAVIAGGMRTPFLLDRFPDLDVERLQDPEDVAETVRMVLTLPEGTVVPEIMVLPRLESSWP